MRTRKSGSNLLNVLILLGFIGLVIMALLNMFRSGKADGVVAFFGNSSGGVYSAQMMSSGSTSTGLSLPGLSQRDINQYRTEEEHKLWSPSACSATATAAVLNSLGFKVRTVDVLDIMRESKAISPSNGLYDYTVFKIIGDRYNLRTDYREGGNIDAHYEWILDNIRKGNPVIINVRDPQYFPNGHFIAGFKINTDNTVSVVNSDPVPGSSVIQNWPVDALKTYFSRVPRSAVYFPR
jgi:hypothetical protein